jgi:DNA-binding CsgD family transcriptional regulator
MVALTFFSSVARLVGDSSPLDDDDNGQPPQNADAGGWLTATLFTLAFLMDQLDEAARWSDRLAGEPCVMRVPVRRAMCETITSAAALRQGAFEEAEEHVRRALETVAPPDWDVVVGIPLSLAVRVSTELRDIPAATAYLAVPVPPEMFSSPFALPYLQARGRYHLALRRPSAALTDFRLCGVLTANLRVEAPELAEWRADAASALIAMGKVQDANELIGEHLSQLGYRPSRGRGIALRLLAATSDLQTRLPVLREAVQILGNCGDRLEQTYARADLKAAEYALWQQDAGELPGVAVVEEEDSGPLLPAGAGLWDDDLLEQVAGRPDGSMVAGLTHAEQRVAILAAVGWTNRQIADNLFITVSTVEQHLTKVYRKLRIRGRPNLPEALSLGAYLVPQS